ncbi:UDP-glucose dehydrogenase family protein [Bacillus rubiinfantis]|uniref:UDP-glucose dehydrogenase family protein n=1 Tax=Bacillus rubiinfantis TaxID=1499680 RepID=UPI0009E4D44E|nr:UDP-glucose/GDP-mannose dehydrogenase family protein [Bacillus rubiinfantis]
MKLLIVGTGYVGTTTGLVFAEMGHQVTGLDVDTQKIQSLQAGNLHFYEPGLDELLRKHVKNETITFTDNIKKAIEMNDVIFICVGTPKEENGSADLSYVKNVAQDIGRYMNRSKVIVTKSTVPVGTAELVTEWIKTSQLQSVPFAVVSNPEFLREGSALADALKPDRIVIGSTSDTARRIMRELYDNFQCPIIETNPKASEMIKYAANSFLALKISFINELARLCDKLEININDVAQGMGLDHRIGPHFFRAGLGYGGSCFPKDVNALLHTAEATGSPLTILESVVQVNTEQPLYLLNKLKQALGGNLQEKTIAVLGLAFKANTDDTRESASIKIIEALINEQANVKVHDPVVKWSGSSAGCHQFKTVADTVSGTDAVMICTDWDEYRELDWSKLKPLVKQPYLFDGRNMVDKEHVAKMGFYYTGVANH